MTELLSRAAPGSLRRAFDDLVWGSACVECGEPGSACCRICADALTSTAPLRSDVLVDVPLVAAAHYRGGLRRAVSQFKEDGVRELKPLLGTLLAGALVELLQGSANDAPPWLLVPVASRASAVRARGRDAVAEMVEEAVRRASRYGVSGQRHSLLRTDPRIRDQAGLDPRQRRLNVAGAMHVDRRALARAGRAGAWAGVVVCDDVVTTGATLREAVRALTSVGVPVFGCVVAAVVEERR